MTAVLRQATMSDAEQIWAVRYAVRENTLAPGKLTDEDLRREIEDAGRGWVVEEEGSIKGFAIGNARTGNIWALFILPESQGRGYGSRLHDVMIRWLRVQGAPTPWLTTGRDTHAAGFYERRGWRLVKVSDNGEALYELPEAGQDIHRPDPYDLRRFLDAQDPVYVRVIGELRSGRKRTHWMWFVFPQLDGLGFSSMARRYAIRSLEEARAYLAHPVLGARLRECSEAVAGAKDRSATSIFASPDDLKFRSCMTLFERVAGEDTVYSRALDSLCDGEKDARTLELLSARKA